MSSELPHPNPEPADEAWQQIDALVDEIARLSKSDVAAPEFYAELLKRVVSGLAALGGIVWTRGPSGQLHPEHQINPGGTRLMEDRASEGRHAQLVALVSETGQSRVLPPHSAAAGDDPAANPSDFLLLVCPWSVDGVAAGAVEVFGRPGASPKAQRGCLQFLEVICELVADFHRNRQLRDLRERAVEWNRLEQFAQRVHGSLDLKATAYTIANEGRQLIGCDRVSVLLRRGSKCRLLAVSGVDAFNRRANVVRQLERLSASVVVMDEPLWHPHDCDDRPPEIEAMLSDCLDQSHARGMAVVPLKPAESEEGGQQRKAVGALVAERFYGTPDERFRGAVAAVSEHAALALQNALEMHSIPLVRGLRMLGKACWLVQGRRLPLTVLALLAVAAAVAALVAVPADFRIEARGELQPVRSRDVFAPADGVVADLRAKHAEQVAANQVLLVLRKPELDFEFKRVGGELQTARKKLAAVEAERIQNRREGDEQRQHYAQLTAQHEELRELISSLEQQYAILEQKQAELEVRSPMGGEVLTWNLEQLLQARPVNRGQILMTVADLQGPWQLELRVPDHRIAHILAAQREIGESLEVSFALATDPVRPLQGTVRRVGMRTEVTESEGAFVLVTVDVNREEMSELIPGATVTAKVYCGRRAVGYVWLHDLIDAIQSWFLL